MMEAVKIVSMLKDKTESIEMYGGFQHAIVLRGVWDTEIDKGFKVLVDDIHYKANKLIFTEGIQPKHGEKCKLLLLEMPTGMLKVAMDARTRMYFLGNNGQTIETIY